MSKSNQYLAHFADVNLGATRDGVLSCHLASDLPYALYKNVVNEFPLPMSNDESKQHLKVLIEYANYAKSIGTPNFFFWFTPCPCSSETSPLAEVDGGIFNYPPAPDDVPPCFIDDLLAFEPLGFYDLDNNNDNDDSFSSPDFYPCRSCSVDTHYSYLDSNEGLCNACYSEY